MKPLTWRKQYYTPEGGTAFGPWTQQEPDPAWQDVWGSPDDEELELTKDLLDRWVGEPSPTASKPLTDPRSVVQVVRMRTTSGQR